MLPGSYYPPVYSFVKEQVAVMGNTFPPCSAKTHLTGATERRPNPKALAGPMPRIKVS